MYDWPCKDLGSDMLKWILKTKMSIRFKCYCWFSPYKMWTSAESQWETNNMKNSLTTWANSYICIIILITHWVFKNMKQKQKQIIWEDMSSIIIMVLNLPLHFYFCFSTYKSQFMLRWTPARFVIYLWLWYDLF